MITFILGALAGVLILLTCLVGYVAINPTLIWGR